MSPTVTATELNLPLFAKGKVRDTYELPDDRLLMVATDRISAFDWVLPTGIGSRGAVLTQLSIFWFEQTRDLLPNHLITGDVSSLPDSVRGDLDWLRLRSMIVKRAQRIDFECVVRGYLAGSAWAEYRERGTMAGEPLPPGLRQSEKLPEPLFTPATKAESGHDENVTLGYVANALGEDLAGQVRDASLKLYAYGAGHAEQHGLLLADTKFEFGLLDGNLILIDEALTPDSSRYWDAASYRPGTSPDSYDKQPVRDWLAGSGWDKNSTPPPLPEAVVEESRRRYLKAYELLTGHPLPPG